MSETGQPGAATPGEHGDGTGRHDEPARTGGGWAPPSNGWSRGAAPGDWPYGDLGGWAASSPRHGDLPAVLPGHPAPEPPARANGHHVNGVHHAAEESPVTRQAPVSAPPVAESLGPAEGDRLAEPPRSTDGDRLVVPAPRPAPAIERPAPGMERPAPGTGPRTDTAAAAGSRHAADDTGRIPRWADSGPASAPPALQVPPVGAAASGFEVPPGFHAPTTERAPSLSRGWTDRAPAEPLAEHRPGEVHPSEHPAHRPAEGHPARRPVEGSAPQAEPRAADRRESADAAGPGGAGEPDWSGPSWSPPSWGDGWAPPWARGDEPPVHDEPPTQSAGYGEPPVQSAGYGEPPVQSAGYGEPPAHDVPPARPAGYGGSPVDRPPYGEPVHRSAPDEDRTAPAGEPAREDDTGRPRAAGWAPEPVRPYEPARIESPSAYEPVRSYEPPRAEPAAGGEPSPPESARPFRLPRADAEPHPGYERPAWAGPPVPVPPLAAPGQSEPVPPRDTPPGGYPSVPAAAPFIGHLSAPAGAPSTGYAPAGYPSAPSAPSPAGSVPADVPSPGADATGQLVDGPRQAGGQVEPATPGPVSGAPAAGGATPFDRAPEPRPTSAPPYAARRSAPEPAPADAVVESHPEEPATPVLPQRVPAEPDVPVVPEPPAVEPAAETPELARIATHLRREDEPAPPRERPEGFDVDAILDAVREVAGVRDATLRRTQAGAHSLRLDLADGADAAEVSRLVARLLQERMGLAAAPQNLPGEPVVPPVPLRRRSARRNGEPRTAMASALPVEAGDGAAGEVRDEPDSPVRGRGDVSARGGVARPAVNRSGEGRFGGTESRAPHPTDAPMDDDEPPRRRRQATHRGRAAVDETSLATAPTGMSTGSPVTLGTSYSGGQMTTTETAPSRPLDTGGIPGPRVVIEHVLVSTIGLDASTEVRLVAGDRPAVGQATGPAVDGYVLRLCAVAAAAAVDELLGRDAVPAGERGRCFVEHTAVVPFGNCEVATVVVLLVCDGWVEQLAGAALVAGDPRQAVVRATLAAVNRRLEALLI
ncbi:hypothetical protein [Micromonospora sp. DT31]|uniref:hypothetical protein n=1 Tax=Micromonospora sp. DT31 TaxID=3393434 RepID=UPI003CE81A17